MQAPKYPASDKKEKLKSIMALVKFVSLCISYCLLSVFYCIIFYCIYARAIAAKSILFSSEEEASGHYQ